MLSLTPPLWVNSEEGFKHCSVCESSNLLHVVSKDPDFLERLMMALALCSHQLKPTTAHCSVRCMQCCMAASSLHMEFSATIPQQSNTCGGITATMLTSSASCMNKAKNAKTSKQSTAKHWVMSVHVSVWLPSVVIWMKLWQATAGRKSG